jgi:hypothetical protein
MGAVALAGFDCSLDKPILPEPKEREPIIPTVELR